MHNEIKKSAGLSPEKKKEVMIFEQSLQSEIPIELKNLLLTYSRVVYTKKKFKRKVDDSFEQEMTLENIMAVDAIQSAMKFLSDEEGIKSNNLLVFGETLGSPVICIGLGENNYGHIYVYDWNFGCTHIANSFNEFINALE